MATTFFNRRIPDECHEKMKELSAGGTEIAWVAFPPGGGNRWSVVTNTGGYFNRNIPDECHMYMGFFSAVYGSVRIVAFDMDGSGWSVTSAVTKAEKVCDAKRCVLIADVYRLHLVAYLPGDVDETAVVEAAARRGVAVYGLAPYRISRKGRPGLLFGYATLGERVLIEGAEILAEAISDVRSR